MAWITPKTDWQGFINSEGNYVGDFFNATDFNRIKNNLIVLAELANALRGNLPIPSLGPDKTSADYFYADEINQFEMNFDIINENTLCGSYGNAPVYVDNGNTMDFTELNRLESAMLDLYTYLTNQFENRRTFIWNFGIKGGL